MSGDGHHITEPHPEGIGARLAMQRALQVGALPLLSCPWLPPLFTAALQPQSGYACPPHASHRALSKRL